MCSSGHLLIGLAGSTVRAAAVSPAFQRTVQAPRRKVDRCAIGWNRCPPSGRGAGESVLSFELAFGERLPLALIAGIDLHHLAGLRVFQDEPAQGRAVPARNGR